jgi:DNA-binding response OmpR family regulator
VKVQSTSRFFIPYNEQPQQDKEYNKMAKEIKVLMVDDEEQFRATTSKILSKKGFATTIAGSGEEAIELLQQKIPDVVILDIKMPGMDGHDTLTQIKKIQPDVQVIMLTGHGDETSAMESLERGAFDYLTKPCDIDLMASKINDAYTAARHGMEKEEKKARDIMIHVSDYTRINVDNTVREAIQALIRSFEGLEYSSRIMQTGHRSVLVFDHNDHLAGILSIQDLIAAIRPAYLSAPKPSMADSMQYSAMFWSGLFTTQVKAMADKSVAELMSDDIISVDEDTNLMEIADLMYRESIRRIIVTSQGRTIGVVREQELFFEIANIIS